MILFYGEGRLGNQVFQYIALTHLARALANSQRETLLAVGLEEIAHVLALSGPPLRVLSKNYWFKRAFKYLVAPFVLRPLSRYLRLFNYANESSVEGVHAGLSGESRLRRGLFSKLTFVDGGYYQNGNLARATFPLTDVALQTSLHDAAITYLRSVTTPSSAAYFVHIRRGDYQNFASYGVNNLGLPTCYFRAGMATILASDPTARFVFVTDDPKWVADEFADIANKAIAAFNPALDFAVMTLCRGGVLSNSTFSLAAALLQNQPPIVVAPKYWFGFRVARWLPPRIRVDDPRVIYLEVDALA
jgi:Glycosyl transferase family 11